MKTLRLTSMFSLKWFSILAGALMISCATDEWISLDPEASMRKIDKSVYADQETPIYHSDFTHEGENYRLRLVVDHTDVVGDRPSEALSVHFRAKGVLWKYNPRTEKYDIISGSCTDIQGFRIYVQGGSLWVGETNSTGGSGGTGIDGYEVEMTLAFDPPFINSPGGYKGSEDKLDIQASVEFKVQSRVSDADGNHSILGSVKAGKEWNIVKDASYPNGVRYTVSELEEFEVRIPQS